jgi:hypothetical protein
MHQRGRVAGESKTMRHKWKWNDDYTEAVCEKCRAKLTKHQTLGMRGKIVPYYLIDGKLAKPMPPCKGKRKNEN